ncbi:hypothetical protein [Aeromonas hydrophila]|uniref:hypothetical protein n=1 Tax=Aeromonas hydrophila TaxID=644 RepID=UPI003D193BD0
MTTPSDEFYNILKGKVWWARILNTQFASGITLFISQMVNRCESLARRLLQEAFLSTALKRASILAGAEDRGYVGRKITPSSGTVAIQNTTDEPLLLPYGFPLQAPNRLDYALAEAIRIDPGKTLNAEIKQLKEVIIKTVMGAPMKWMEIALPIEISAQASKVDVWVQPPGGINMLWEKRFQFRRADGSSRVYAESYKPSEQLVIRFGNGLTGMIPPEGSVISLHVWCTKGESTLIEGQNLRLVGQSDDLTNSIKITSVTPITGGAPAETTEEIRRGALYATPYDEQVVWENDYITFIRSNITGLTWLRVWGELAQEQESGFDLEHIGRIYVSAYSPTQSQERLAELIIKLLISTKDLNRRYSYVPVNRQPFTIALKGTIQQRQNQEDVRQALIKVLSERFGENAVPGATAVYDETSEIYEKDIWTEIDKQALLVDFTIEVVGRLPRPKLRDYVFLDAATSDFALEYQR